MNPVDILLSNPSDSVKELEPAAMAPGEEGEEEGRVCWGQQFSVQNGSPVPLSGGDRTAL